jgi:hypothetical protein
MQRVNHGIVFSGLYPAKSSAFSLLLVGGKTAVMQNLLNWSLNRRLRLIRQAVCIFFLIGIALSLPLWHGQRFFPLIPAIPGMGPLPAPLDYVLLVLLAIAAILNVVRSRRLFAGLLIGLMAVMVFLDQMRLQPWVFIYFLVMFPFALTDLQDEKAIKKHGPSVLNFIMILLIGVYVWSGLHKFTDSFAEVVHPMLLKGLFRIPDGSWLLTAKPLAYGAASVELIIGLGLIFPKTRNLAVIGAILTHLLIIAWVSPLGGNSNYIVLPWNAAMIALVFLGAYNVKTRLVLWPAPPLRWATAALALLVWVMPVLNLKDKWDAYLSFNLYTERISHLFVALRQDALDQSDPRLSAYYAEERLIEEGRVIDMELWSFAELKVPVYPAPRVFRAIGRHFCRPSVNPDQVMFTTYRRPFREGHYEVFFCSDCQ